MDTETKPSKIHPLTAAAAVAVILVSVTGIAAMTGMLPNFSKTSAPENVTPAPEIAAAPTASQPAVTAPSSATAQTAPPPESPPAKKPAVKKPTAVASNAAPQTQQYSEPAAAPVPVAPPPPPPPPPPCYNCGVVESVHAIQQQAPTSGVGAAAGALLGGVLGHQVGGGNGKTLATIAGAVGGGLAGNAVEQNKNTTSGYEIIVRMEDGSRQRFIIKEQRWRSGDQVRIDNGNISARYQ